MPTPSPTALALLPPSHSLQSHHALQSLWAGYGHIYALQTSSGPLILKQIDPPPAPSPRPSESHLRKVYSYAVESHFYTHLAPSLPPSVPVPRCIAAHSSSDDNNNGAIALVLSDLRPEFPVEPGKRGTLSPAQTRAALAWLAGFHAHFAAHAFHPSELRLAPLDEAPRRDAAERRSVWRNGGYTYLATRRDEYQRLLGSSSEWAHALSAPLGTGGRSVAEVVALVLAPFGEKDKLVQRHATLLHGDVKSENLFSSADGARVAFFDFQYVGLGLGVCDLAKLFTCSVEEGLLVEHAVGDECEMGEGERGLLDAYWRQVTSSTDRDYAWAEFKRHWETALVDWLRFQASWGFWGNTEWLEARVRSILKDQGWRAWVVEQEKMMET